MKVTIEESLRTLKDYIEGEDFKGYDPYDTLNSVFPIGKMGKWASAIAIQLQKRNPIQIRPLLGVKKGYNSKGLGLMLKAYCLAYRLSGDEKDLQHAHFLFNWLRDNVSQGYSGACWGYNFDWANPGGYLKSYAPSVVVTAFVVDGVVEYYKLTKDVKAKALIVSSAEYILNDLPITEQEVGVSIAYTHQSSGACYNASLLGAETLAKVYSLTGDKKLLSVASAAVDFVLTKQKEGGEWLYSYNPETKQERKQIDFHQGFILVSLSNYLKFAEVDDSRINIAIAKGLKYYRKEQFFDDGRSLWRLPKEHPTEIHNQSQGIITFALLSDYDTEYLEFAKQIAKWTVANMQDKRGYFYYQFHKNYKIKIPYMRWSQAWMMLALVQLQDKIKNEY